MWTSCFVETPDMQTMVFKEDIFIFCDYGLYPTILLTYLGGYWDRYALSLTNDPRELTMEDVVLPISKNDIRSETMGLFPEEKFDDAIEDLINRGAIHIVDPDPEWPEYINVLLDTDHINKRILINAIEGGNINDLVLSAR